MGKTNPPHAEDNEAKELVRLCRAGRLYEIERWINDGKSLEIPATTNRGRQRSLLENAVETGFHSLVELIAKHEAIQEEERKLEQLNKWADLWERAERLRRFISAYAEKCHAWSAKMKPQYRAWIERATKQADRIDPFVSEKPASVLDRKHELSA